MLDLLREGLAAVGLRVLERIHRSSTDSSAMSLAAENLYAAVRGIKVRFRRDDAGALYAKEGTRELRISNKYRGFWLYRDGIEARASFIFQSYCLQNINFKQDDVVFDCGANSGDLFLKLSEHIRTVNYYAFEPNPADYSILTKNVAREANLLNLALGDSDDNLSFFISTRSGDSSLVEPKVWDTKISVPVVRLDSFIKDKSIGSIKLLKLEAEGYEPEILRGLGSMIQRCEYIAVDGGYERGKDCEQTLTTCTNYLLANGFEMVDIYFPWFRALYRRK